MHPRRVTFAGIHFGRNRGGARCPERPISSKYLHLSTFPDDDMYIFFVLVVVTRRFFAFSFQCFRDLLKNFHETISGTLLLLPSSSFGQRTLSADSRHPRFVERRRVARETVGVFGNRSLATFGRLS